MREFDILKGYPEPKEPRWVHQNIRTIQNRINASYRDRKFYDGDRNDGYGGFQYDGRWEPIARNICKKYALDDQSAILQIGCDKGFLLHELLQLHPGMEVVGTEISDYAIACGMPLVKPKIQKTPFQTLPFRDGKFDFVIAIGAVYTLNLSDAIACLKEIQRVSKGKSFITLGAYDGEEDFRLFRYWTLLGCTVLPKSDWIEVLKHVGYTGDYKFNTAGSLNLKEAFDVKSLQ
ncbi:MAG: class I SAM-dependent methyltransferase [Deltaproteobacteria bacterium]|nr:class I SAM-dependent methyltransferase [Deltaproteobacteria bacterium]